MDGRLLFVYMSLALVVVCACHSTISLNSCTVDLDEDVEEALGGLISSKVTGRPGKAGEKGVKGSQGQRGPRGESCECSEYAELRTRLEEMERRIGGRVFGYTRFADQLWYKLHKNKVNYASAKQACAAEGGRLASTGLRNPTVREAVKRGLVIPGGFNVWIGLDDLAVSDRWMWSDGVVSTRSNTDWYPSEPNNSIERCGEMRLTLDWHVNDKDCSTEFYFLCEISF